MKNPVGKICLQSNLRPVDIFCAPVNGLTNVMQFVWFEDPPDGNLQYAWISDGDAEFVGDGELVKQAKATKICRCWVEAKDENGFVYNSDQMILAIYDPAGQDASEFA